MSKFNSLRSIASRLNELTEKIYSSKLEGEELEEMENLARQIYERAVILNYKSKEESVFGRIEKEESETNVNSYSETIEKEEVLPTLEKEEEIIETPEPEIKEESVSAKEPELPVKDLTASTGLIQFDFSEDAPFFEEDQKIEPEEKSEIEDNQVVSAEKTEGIVQEKFEEEVEEPILEKTVFSEKNEEISNGDYNYFLKIFSQSYQEALKDRIGNSKIESINYAMGLNDRLLYIRELFNGDTDDFNAVVEELNNLENIESAHHRLSELAVHKKWEKGGEAAEHFVKMVNRRYVP